MNFKILLIVLSICIFYPFALENHKNKRTNSNLIAKSGQQWIEKKNNNDHHRNTDQNKRNDDHRRNDEKWLIEKSENSIDYCNDFHEKYSRCCKIFLQNRCSKYYREYVNCQQNR